MNREYHAARVALTSSQGLDQRGVRGRVQRLLERRAGRATRLGRDRENLGAHGDAAIGQRLDLARVERPRKEDELGHDDRDAFGGGGRMGCTEDAEAAFTQDFGAESSEGFGQPYENGRRRGHALDRLAFQDGLLL